MNIRLSPVAKETICDVCGRTFDIGVTIEVVVPLGWENAEGDFDVCGTCLEAAIQKSSDL